MDISTTHGQKHFIVSSIDCPYQGTACEPGFFLLERLNSAIAAGVRLAVIGDGFELDGSLRVETCSRDCLIGFRAGCKRSYVFGDIEEGCDLDRLVAGAGAAGAMLVSERCDRSIN